MSDLQHTASAGELTEPNPATSWLGGLTKMWRDVWRYEHLVSNFVQRDLRVKYRNSALGYFWSLLEPLLLSGVYIVLFGILAGKPQPLYPFWVVMGVLCWRFFGTVLTSTVNSLVANEGTINSLYFPRALFGVASSLSQLVMCSLSMLVAVPFLIYYGLAPTPYLFMVPLGLMMLWMMALGAGLGLACLNVVNRDVGFTLAFVVRVGFYITPVLWTVEMGQARGRSLQFLLFNPTAVPITMVRNGFTGDPLPVGPGMIAWSVGFAVVAFFVGAMIFQRYESEAIKKL